MAKVCDHTSVGMLVFQGENLLLIERKKFPFGFAPPAGYVDSDPDFETAARRELAEEVGLTADEIELVAEGRKENKCRREGGSWHYWKIYRVDATGELHRSPDETKQARFFTPDQIRQLLARTQSYLDGQIAETDWEAATGIEPVWAQWFDQLDLFPEPKLGH